jgi:hypothetical protein
MLPEIDYNRRAENFSFSNAQLINFAAAAVPNASHVHTESSKTLVAACYATRRANKASVMPIQ